MRLACTAPCRRAACTTRIDDAPRTASNHGRTDAHELHERPPSARPARPRRPPAAAADQPQDLRPRLPADAFAVAARTGAENELGLGWALGKHLDSLNPVHGEDSLVLAAYRAGIPCTVHVALGTDIVHMHPHVSGAALGEASLIDFRRLCAVVATMQNGVWLNLGSAVVLPEVFIKTVSVARNFGQ